MSKLIDLTGRRFGRWLVTAYAHGSRLGAYWRCICDCDACRVVNGHELRRGGSKSCGCLQREQASARCKTHGMSKTMEYVCWQQMRARCFNPHHRAFENYGGRGISVCEPWANSFEAFFADMGTRPEGCSLDRIDVNGNYEPGNVRWADSKTQTQNRRPRRVQAAVKRCRPEPLRPLDDVPF
jgi:hypothetical protein